MHESNEMSFGWCFIIYFLFWKMCSSLDIFWSWMWSGTWTFFCGSSNTIGIRTWQWRVWMRCHVERGYGNLTPCGSTLWVRVKRHAIHHGCIVLCTEDTWKATTRVHRVMCTRKIGREHSTYCRRNLVCDQPVSQYSISLRTYHFLTSQDDVIDQCWPDCGILISSTSYSGFDLSLVQLIAWAENTYIEFGLWDALALWGQWPHLVILFVWEFCDEMFRYCEDNTYIIVIVTYGSYTWSYGVHFIVPEKTLVISMRTTLFWEDFGLHCGLAITVVERLQRYNCIWLTYIDNVGQNILFYIEVGSCEMLSLCGKLIWRRNIVFWLCFVFRRRLYRYLVWITSFLRS